MGVLTGEKSEVHVPGWPFADDFGPSEATIRAHDRLVSVRTVLIAFDQRPEEELFPELIVTAREIFLDFQALVQSFHADGRNVSSGTADEFMGDLFHKLRPIAERASRELRPYLGSIESGDIEYRSRMVGEAVSRVGEAEGRLAELEGKAATLIERVGVGRLANHYETEAVTQGEMARRWLVGVAICTGLLLAVVVWLLVESLVVAGQVTWAEVGTMIATKALALGVLSFMVSFCSRNYRSHRHVQITYRQRMAALDTYSLMALSLTDDTDGRRIVLSELAKSVFAPSDTGMSVASSGGDTTIIENAVPMFSAIRGGN